MYKVVKLIIIGLDAGVAISKAGQTITLLKPFGTNLNNSNIISFTVDGLTGEATTTSFATISAYKQDSKLGKRIIESWVILIIYKYIY